ncbi:MULTISPECIES: aromatic amino acid ammonia-lyase [unclassified Bosea (in: a-proteobacteria)]|uniref:aromatic amino acid ammonia-lyase n=1 Tax=unclassified Bosea (in: a-proteobacteria) TaxID=2653178 RepID=UPI0012F1A317|nr:MULTISPECIES: aromatic amino acid ammonia-lyase [unclassified Bosea (in: a-proteobacteria)]CAD5294293.1 Histidine ammonia-lyase [Bosea sp. 46]VXB41151.1 Histidine ammonia-lyase [Bosea sp. 127]
MQNIVAISGRDLTPAGIVQVARSGAKVVLTREAIERIGDAREVVDEVVRKGEKIYGVTSSVGAKTGTMLAPDRIPEFNRRLLLTHNMGHGPLASHETVRAMMIVLLNSMATGYLGVRPVMADRLVEALNTDRRIDVHLWGSMGQSDMSPIADLALELYKDHEFAAGEALALLNSSALSIGTAALAFHDLERMLDFATLAGAFSMEGFAANPSIVSEAALSSRPFDGVLRHGRAIRNYLAGSYLTQPGGPRHLQDPLSFRSLPLIHGNAADSLGFAGRQLSIELSASQNNPVVAIEQRQLVSVANFDMVALAMTLDIARLALVPVVTSSTERLAKQADSFWSGLSVGLVEEDGVGLPGFNGLAQFHKSITSEARLLGAPVVNELASSSHSNGNLDRASMAGLAARRTAEMATLCLSIFGMELMVAAQAVEMRKAKPLGAVTHELLAFVRRAIPYAGAGERVPHAGQLIDHLVANDAEIDSLIRMA